jgi:mannose-6-phosphate isomerase
VWGGGKLKKLYHKDAGDRIGESWEISGVKNHVSVIANGVYQGKDLNFLTAHFGASLLGKKVVAQYGLEFPLLFKLIDAKEDLSVQLHPDDAVANKRHNSLGKTEMWYILNADSDARLILGFKEHTNKEVYLDQLSKGKITEILKEVPVKEGDAFFIQPGTVHAIGAGIVLAEIQQTSDITYRIYDWDRPDVNGEKRELHTEEALDIISFMGSESATLNFRTTWNHPVEICQSKFFRTSLLQLNHNIQLNYDKIDSFVVYMCVEGDCKVESGAHSISLLKGESILIPAIIDEVTIKTNNATILEVFVP